MSRIKWVRLAEKSRFARLYRGAGSTHHYCVMIMRELRVKGRSWLVRTGTRRRPVWSWLCVRERQQSTAVLCSGWEGLNGTVPGTSLLASSCVSFAAAASAMTTDSNCRVRVLAQKTIILNYRSDPARACSPFERKLTEHKLILSRPTLLHHGFVVIRKPRRYSTGGSEEASPPLPKAQETVRCPTAPAVRD